MKRIPTGYSLHECPPAKETALLSIQQIIVAVFNVIPVPLLIGAGIGLSASEITLLVAGCLLVTGLATILQCLGAGPAGARLPIVLECSFVFVAPGIAFDAGTCVTISILCVVALVELMGDLSTASMLSETALPTDREVRGGVLAQGISSILSALFNMVPTISGSANIGLCGITGVTSRFVVAVTGGVIAVCSVCPKLCAIFTAIPSAILGGVALMAFGTILVSGMNVIRESQLDARKATIVGASLAVGIGFSMVPDALAAFPFWASALLSGVPGTAITAIVLNLILREKRS